MGTVDRCDALRRRRLSAIVVHRLADRGLIDYDEPVAKYWSEFAGSNITVRKLMLHRGGLSQLRGIASHPGDLLDHELMHTRLAMALPDRHFGAPPITPSRSGG